MALISKLQDLEGNVHDLKDARLSGIFPVIGTQTASTGAWTGTIDLPELFDGLTIAYFLPYATPSSTNVTLNLTLSDGSTTGAVNVYFTGTTRMTTHAAVGSTVILTYWSKGSVKVSGTAIAENRWTRADYDYNSNTVGEYAGSCTAGPNGMARYSLILQVSENRWESLVLTSSTAATKTKNTSGFLVTSPIMYQNASTYTEGQNAGNSSCWSTSYNVDTRYSCNVSSTWSAAGKPLYLVGTIESDRFYLKDTTWWSNELPTEADGLYYWYVGQMSDAYRFSLHPVHPIYYYDGGIQVYVPGKVRGLTWGDIAGQ